MRLANPPADRIRLAGSGSWEIVNRSGAGTNGSEVRFSPGITAYVPGAIGEALKAISQPVPAIAQKPSFPVTIPLEAAKAKHVELNSNAPLVKVVASTVKGAKENVPGAVMRLGSAKEKL